MIMKPIRYIFANPPLNRKEIRVRGIGIREPMRPGIVDRPHGTGDYLFMFYYDQVELQTINVVEKYEANVFMIWPPGTHQMYGNPAQGYLHSWIHCDGSYITDCLSNLKIPIHRPFAFPYSALVEKYLLDLHHEITGQSKPDIHIVKNVFENWMREIRRAIGTNTIKNNPSAKFLELKNYIDIHFREHLHLSDLAELTHLSIPHFCSEFKRYFGTGAIEYLIQARMNQAAYLLRDYNLPINEISRRVGYDDIYHFSKLFKNHFGRSARQMRKDMG